MALRNGNDLSEVDCYTKILNYYINKKKSQPEIDIWKDHSFIKLMDILERTHDKILVKNAIIILITLFEDVPPDIFNNRGSHINNITSEEKEILMSQLKAEFLPN